MTPIEWKVRNGPTSYHDSPSGDPIEIGYVWTIDRLGHERLLRIEVAPGAVYNDLVISAVLRNQLAEEQPAGRVLILASGDLRFSD